MFFSKNLYNIRCCLYKYLSLCKKPCEVKSISVGINIRQTYNRVILIPTLLLSSLLTILTFLIQSLILKYLQFEFLSCKSIVKVLNLLPFFQGWPLWLTSPSISPYHIQNSYPTSQSFLTHKHSICRPLLSFIIFWQLPLLPTHSRTHTHIYCRHKYYVYYLTGLTAVSGQFEPVKVEHFYAPLSNFLPFFFFGRDLHKAAPS